MASKLGEAFIEIVSIDNKYRESLKKVEGDSAKTAKVVESRFAKMGEVLAGVAASLGVAAGLNYAVTGAMEAEAAEANLKAALMLTGEATAANIEKFKLYAAQVQATTAYEDDAIVAEMAYGKSLGISASQLQEATTAAIGLASKYQLDLHTAMMLVGKAANGNTAMFKRYNIVLTEGATDQQKFQEVLAKGKEGFAMAEAYAGTTAGKFAQFKNAVNGLADAFGMALLPLLTMAVAVIKPVVEWFSRLNPHLQSALLIMGGIGVVALNAAKWIVWLRNAYDALAKSTVAVAVAEMIRNKEWVKAGLVVTTVVAAIAGVGMALDAARGDADAYAATLSQSMRDQMTGLNKVNDGLAAVAANKKELEKSDKEDPFKAQAMQLYEIYKNSRMAREEDEKRMRAAVGFKGLGELWKGAAVSGATSRFTELSVAQKTDSRFRVGDPKGMTVNMRDWLDAVATWKASLETQKKTEQFIGDVADSLRRGA